MVALPAVVGNAARHPVFYIAKAVRNFGSQLAFTVAAIFFIQEAGMGALQLVLVGTVLEATVLLFEVPTGIVADLYSRRRSVIIGQLVIGAAFVFEGAFANVATILAAQFVWGLGWTFISGAETAWISGEVGESDTPNTILRGVQIARFSGIAGIAVGAALGALTTTRIPIILGGVLIIGLGLYLAFRMPESGFVPLRDKRQSLRTAMVATFRAGLASLRGRPLLYLLFAAAIVGGMSSEGFDRLWEARFITEIGLPDVLETVLWIGAIRIVDALLGIVAIEFARRRFDFNDHHRLSTSLSVVVAVRLIGVIAFGLSGQFVAAIVVFLGASSAASIEHPVYEAWLATSVPSRVRATVLSAWGQLDALGQVLGGPIVGVIAGAISITAALVTSGILLVPIAVAFWVSGRRSPAHGKIPP